MRQISVVLVALSLHVQGVITLECYTCTNAAHVIDCKSVVQCPDGSACQSVFQSNKYTLRCVNQTLCPTTNATALITGRSVTMTVEDGCSQCCHSSNCNRQLCQGEDPFCKDKTDCATTANIFNLCSDTNHAKKVCKRFCGLCNLVDGAWAAWGGWSGCSVTCGNGTATKTRSCTDPSPENGGSDCVGPDHETKACVQDPCPVNGGWGDWSSWGICSATCGIGLRRRDRTCSRPYPSTSGLHCFGDARDDEVCISQPCQGGGWSQWNAWGTCSRSCDGGIQTRSRTCANIYLGHVCLGDVTQVQQCASTACFDGHWSDWGSWGGCSQSCDHGVDSRTRSCTNPPPSVLGQSCTGNNMDVRVCFQKTCITQNVGFTAWYVAETSTSGNVKFTHLITNEGGAYNNATGSFTCPVPGMYYFSLHLITIRSSEVKSIECWIYKNAGPLAYTFSDPDSHFSGGNYETGTSAVVHLSLGDVVQLRNCTGASTIHTYSSFSGVLIKAD